MRAEVKGHGQPTSGGCGGLTSVVADAAGAISVCPFCLLGCPTSTPGCPSCPLGCICCALGCAGWSLACSNGALSCGAAAGTGCSTGGGVALGLGVACEELLCCICHTTPQLENLGRLYGHDKMKHRTEGYLKKIVDACQHDRILPLAWGHHH